MIKYIKQNWLPMLSILHCHENTTRFFQQQKTVWDFFANHSHKEEQLKEFKTDLLKNTYKFDEASDTGLYQKVALAKENYSSQFLLFFTRLKIAMKLMQVLFILIMRLILYSVEN